jgi:uncharacterized membrane protein YoaK (UPF0700 family)
MELWYTCFLNGLELLDIDFKYIHIIIFTLIIFVVGKMILRRFIYRKKEEIDK